MNEAVINEPKEARMPFNVLVVLLCPGGGGGGGGKGTRWGR